MPEGQAAAQAGNDGAQSGAQAGSQASSDKNQTIVNGGAQGDDGQANGADGKQANGSADGDGGKQAAPDWRARFAGEDKDALKRLGRFSDEVAFFKSYRALEGKLSSGEYKRNLPADASEADIKAWRKEQGIPADDAEYVSKLALPNGLVLGEEDKPIVESFAKKAHAGNWTPQQFNDAVSWYYENLDQQRAEREDADAAYKQNSEEALRADWQGPEYRRNLTAVNNLLAGAPEGVADRILAGRTADGRLFGDDPAIIKWLAQMAFELNPAATVVPSSVGDMGKTIDDRINDINNLMRAPKGSPEWRSYWKNDKVQQEYRDLLDAQAKMKSRSAA